MSKRQRSKSTDKPVRDDHSIHVRDIKGNTGTAIGGHAKSDVRFKLGQSDGKSMQSSKTNSGQILLTRVVALILGVFGVLGAVALFLRLISGFDPIYLFMLILAVIITVLGVIGTLKADAVFQLFRGIIDRR